MSSSSTSTDSISIVQVGGVHYEEDVVAPPCCFSQENITSEGFFLPDSPTMLQFLSNPELKDVHDPPQHYCHNQGHEVEGAHAKESKGKQPLQEGQSCPPDKCTHDFAGKRRASERKRRKRINSKVKTLQELIPHSDKKDQASILDEAINYIQYLKLQVNMMRPRMQVGPMTGYGPSQFQMGPSGYPLILGPGPGGGGFGFQVQPFPVQPEVAIPPPALFCPPPQFFPATTATATTATFPRPPFFPPMNQPTDSPNQEGLDFNHYC